MVQRTDVRLKCLDDGSGCALGVGDYPYTLPTQGDSRETPGTN